MRSLFACHLIFVVTLFAAEAVAAEPLTFSYLERPPYYYRDNSGDAAGFLVERTQQILAAANLEAQFISLEPSQIMFLLHRASAAHCSIGWFKTDERQLFAKFTQPIYQDQALVLLTHRSRRYKFPAIATLEKVFADRKLTIARLGQFSYGNYVDDLLEKLSPASLFRSNEQAQLLQAIQEKSADYMLIAPEEGAMLISSAGLQKQDFVSLPLLGVPEGNQRHLMCGQGVSDRVMQQLNAAIEQLYPASGVLSRR